MSTKDVPPELLSLVQHVELNKAGWWNLAVQRIIVAAAWFVGTPASASEIQQRINGEFGFSLSDDQLHIGIESLCASGDLFRLSDARLRLTEAAASRFLGDVARSERTLDASRGRFRRVLQQTAPGLDPDQTWSRFNEGFLLPLLRRLGANIYALLGGRNAPIDPDLLEHFLMTFEPDDRTGLRDALLAFLDPTDADVRAFLLGSLTAYFFLEASSLAPSTLDRVQTLANVRPKFTVFLDTNFLFSFLGLHDNPSNEVALSLASVISSLPRDVTVRLYVLPPTVDEAKRVLIAHLAEFRDVRLTLNMAQAVPFGQLSGISQRYVEKIRTGGQYISAEDYFGPYLDGFLSILRARGGELYNQTVEPYRKRQDVIDDILDQQRFYESPRPGRPSRRPKSYEQIEHDMILWHFVEDKRPRRTESPLQAEYWIVTVDYRLLGFDRFKAKQRPGNTPLCIHPSTLIQMLQFWVPRTPEFEQALVESMRLPFLFRDCDAAAERLTIRILRRLGRFENVDGLSPDTVASIVLNDALRQKMRVEQPLEREIELVRDALVDEHARVRRERDALEQRARQLETEARHAAAEDARKAEEIRALSGKIAELDKQLQSFEASKRQGRERGRFWSRWIAAGTMGTMTCGVVGWSVGRAARIGGWSGTPCGVVVGLLIWVWLLGRAGGKSVSVRESRGFRRFRRVRRHVLGTLGAVLLGLLGNAVYALVVERWFGATP